MEYIISYVLAQMPQAIDDVNVTTILSIVLKLKIESKAIIDSIIPFCYKIADYNRLIICIHMISMMRYGKENTSFRALVVKSASELPISGPTLTFKEIGRLCESLVATKLYSEDLGGLIIWLLSDDLKDRRIELTSFSSILKYLAHTGLGDRILWRIYSKYTLENITTGDPKALMRLLESFMERGYRNNTLLSSCGNILVNHISHLSPTDIANIAHIYHISDCKHDVLFNEIINISEMIIGHLDSKAAVKLLGLFNHIYRQSGNANFAPKHFRSIMLIFNRCAITIETYNLKELLVIVQGIKQFPYVKSTQLEKNLAKYLNECFHLQPVLSPEGKTKSQFYASMILSGCGKKRRLISPNEAFLLQSQLVGTQSLPQNNSCF